MPGAGVPICHPSGLDVSWRDVKKVAKVTSTESRVGQSKIRLLGCFELSVDAEPATVSVPGQRLLGVLALDHGRIIERTYLAGTLWPDSSEAAARSNLRSALCNFGPLRQKILEIMPGGLRLAPRLRVDLHERREKARRLLDTSYERVEASFSAFSTDLLPHWDEPWVEPEREAYRQLRLHVLEHLSKRLTKLGRFAEAMEAALLAVEGGPFRESAHRAVIRALAAEGNRGEAMNRYTDLCAVLDRELGIEPSFRMDDVLGELAESNAGRLDA
jgi:DNA-binding SARP family transcriptional activator